VSLVGPQTDKKVIDVCKKVFGDVGDVCEKISEWCVKRETPGVQNAIPKGKVANVFVVIEPLSRLLIRHEADVLDVTTVPTYAGHSVPAILHTKLHAVVRRQMLAMLHEWYDRKGFEELKKDEVTGKYFGDGYKYTCVVRPYARREKGERAEEAVEGYCKKCPACMIFGYAAMEERTYNVKSRIEGDLYVAPVSETNACVTVTFNAVDDITKTTYIGAGPEPTGALYQLRLVEVGTPFIGKIAIKDVTLAELMLTLVALARTTRIGGRVTHFGEIKIHIPAILFSSYEVGSGYEIANNLLVKFGGSAVKLEQVLNEVEQYVSRYGNRGILVVDRGLAEKLRELTQGDVDDIILRAWRDSIVFKESLDQFVGRSVEDKGRSRAVGALLE
jgi:CRISPR-associated protein Csc2